MSSLTINRTTARGGFVLAGMVMASAVALAVASRPQYDPYGWLLWGREILHGSPSFSTINYPSWKPLGALLGLVVAPTGGAAPVVWLLVARTLGLVGVAAAYALVRPAAGRVAGAVAGVALICAPGWMSGWLDGHLEPAVATLLIGAVWLDRRAHYRLALAALGCAALARPEAFAALCIYAVLVARRDRALVRDAVAWCAAVPLLWVGGDLLGSGRLDHGGALARAAGSSSTVSGAGGMLMVWAQSGMPLIALGVLAWLVRTGRAAGRTVWLLAGGAAIWFVLDVVLAAQGYPADARYLVPQAAALSVVAALGLARLARVRRAAVRVLLAVGLAALLVPGLAGMPGASRGAHSYSDAVQQLQTLIGSHIPDGDRCALTVAPPFRTAVAWYSDRGTVAVTRLHPGGLLLVGRRVGWPRAEDLIARGEAPVRVASAGPWSARLLAGTERPACALALHAASAMSTGPRRGRPSD